MRIFFLGLVFICLISCSEKETPGGIKFTVLKKGDGVEVETGKYVLVHMVLHNHKDSLLLSTYTNEQPMIIAMPDGSMAKDPGEFGVIKMLTKGDCVTFKLPAKTVFTNRRRAVPKDIDPAGLFTFVLHLKETWTLEEVNNYQAEQSKKMNQKQLTIDSAIISDYLKTNNLTALSTSSGLRYIIQKAGVGETAKKGNVAYIHYAGFLLDGKIFDTSLAEVAKANNFNNGPRNEPYRVSVAMQEVVAGWDEMIQLMNKGMKVTVFIPSYLGYGAQGSGIVPPNAVMKFDMELVELK